MAPLLLEGDAWSGNAVVTGGGSGIGRALAIALARRSASRIFILDRDAAAAAETATLVGATATSIALDVTDTGTLTGIVDRIAREHGPIAAWFSNAGVNHGEGLGTAEDWRLALDVNLMAHVHAAALVLPAMEARGAGRFVITASAAGLLSDLRTAAYSASKHAAVGFAEWLAIGIGEGVSIHCLCPEGVMTGMTRADSVNAAAGIAFLPPDEVAVATLDGIERGDFLILSHPRTAEFERRRITDRPRWLAGMRRARLSTLALDCLFPASPGV